MSGESLSFGTVADAYDRARPGYPVEAARWLTGEDPVRALELGAGTGKLTETLVGLGHNVMASDPDERMLQLLQQRAPGAHVRTHGAEEIPLPDQIADVVICAQAWHWFDHEVAIPEIARVLKPGGVLALVWNERDESVPWVARLGRLMGSNDSQDDQVATLRESEVFPEIEEATFRHWQHLDRRGVLDLAASRSYVATLSEADREATLARVSELYDDYGRGPDGMKLPYVTRCFRARVQHGAVEVPVSDGAATGAQSTDPAFAPGPGLGEERFPAQPSRSQGKDKSQGQGDEQTQEVARPPAPGFSGGLPAVSDGSAGQHGVWTASRFPGGDATLLIDFR